MNFSLRLNLFHRRDRFNCKERDEPESDLVEQISNVINQFTDELYFNPAHNMLILLMFVDSVNPF